MAHNLDIIDKLYSTLRKLQPLKPEDKARLDKKFRLEFNYNSNHIEGNTLTYGETELLLIIGNTIGSHTKRELDEMQAHDTAYYLIQQWAKDEERLLTEQDIKELNKIILVSPFWKDAKTADGQDTRVEVKIGSYKEQPNFVRFSNGEKLNFPSPADTPILMRELIDWYRKAEGRLHPITLATTLHHKLVSIHPFDDGNGRIARLLMNYVLIKHDYPPAIIKSSDKPKYLRALQLADVGEYEALIDYIAEQVIWSLETSVKAAKGESLEEADDFVKEIELIKRKALAKGKSKSINIIEEVYQNTFEKAFDKLYNTFNHFDDLFGAKSDTFRLTDVQLSAHHYNKIDLSNDMSKRFKPVEEGLISEVINAQELLRQNLKKITWEHKMNDLIGTESLNVDVELNVTFNKYDYVFEVTINGTALYNFVKRYDSFISQEEVGQLDKTVKDYLLEFIKEKID